MSILRKSLRGSFELSMSQALTFGCSFVRLAILARILDKADFGIAATFAITVVLVEMISNMSLDMLIVQSRDGDNLAFQGTAHLLQALRGIFNATLLLLLAWPISYFFKIPEARWAFQWLAIVPLLRGFIHLDINRLERKMNFRPKILAEVIPELLITVAAWPMAVWLKDYSAFLWLLLAKGVFTLVTSHLIAERSYRWLWQRSHLKEVVRFAWPLLLNSMLMFLSTQGDRFAIGAFYTMADLGTFSAAAALVIAAGTGLIKITNAVFLPVLSHVQDEPDSFKHRYQDIVRTLVVIAALFGPLFILFGEPVVVCIYGEKFRDAGVLVAWLGAAQALRVIRAAPTLAAIAKGDTKCPMFSNMLRGCGFCCAFLFAYGGMPLSWIAVAALLGEVVAMIGILQLLARRHCLQSPICYRPAIIAAFGMSFAAFLSLNGTDGLRISTKTVALSAWGLVCLAVVHSWYPDLIRHIPSVKRRLGLWLGTLPK